MGIPFLAGIIIVLATAPTWHEITWFLRDREKEREKWRAPEGYVSARELREFAYKNDKVYLLDRLDKHYAAKAAAENIKLARLAASFVVTVIISAVIGYSGHATMVWRLFDWSSGLSENLQKWLRLPG